MSDEQTDNVERDARLTALYRAAAQDEPPSALDDAIRAAARRAVSSRPQVASAAFRVRSWGIPLSIAAVVVLSVSLVFVMREETPELAAPPRADESANALRRAETPGTVVREGAISTPKTLAPATQAPGGAGLKPSTPASEPAAEVRGRSTKADSIAKQPERNGANLPSPRSQHVTPEAFPGDTAGAESKNSAPAEIRARSKSEAESSFGIVRDGSQEKAQVPPAPAVAAIPAARAPAAAPLAKTEPQVMGMAGGSLVDAKLPPEKWLERIEELRKQGKLDDAKASLAAFRRRYPDYLLPAALKDGIKP